MNRTPRTKSRTDLAPRAVPADVNAPYRAATTPSPAVSLDGGTSSVGRPTRGDRGRRGDTDDPMGMPVVSRPSASDVTEGLRILLGRGRTTVI